MNARPKTRTRSVSSGIPAYSSSGRRLRNYSVDAIERILQLEPPGVVVKRNKRTGRICSAQFLPLPQNSKAVEGKEPIKKTAHMGQSYSFRQALEDSGRRAWSFSRLLLPGDDEDMERRLQMIFRAVPLSCLTLVQAPSLAEPATIEVEASEVKASEIEASEPEPDPPAASAKVVSISTGRGFRRAVSNDTDERLAA